MASKPAGNGHLDDKLIRAVQVTDSLGRIIDDELAVTIAGHHTSEEDSHRPLGRLAAGKIPQTWRAWRELSLAVELLASRAPGSVSVRQLGFWVRDRAQCSQCDGVMAGVLTGTSTPIDVEDCDECQRYNGPLEAAYALALQVGGQVWFYQHDPELLEKLACMGDVHLQLQAYERQGFRKRTYTPDKIGSASVLSGTNPWIEFEGEPVNWDHVSAVLRAVLAIRAKEASNSQE